MRIDYAFLGKELTEAGLVGKPVDQYNKEEVEKLCIACANSILPDIGAQFTEPSINAEGILVIPFDSDPRFHFWKKCGQSEFETLRELKASDEVWRKYTERPYEPF
jgi:hypothetical protein